MLVNFRKPSWRGWWCPECGGRLRHGKPLRWTPRWGRRPNVSHLDGTALCPVMTSEGYRPADPTAQRPDRARADSDEPPMSPTWYARVMAKAAQDLHRALEYSQPLELASVSTSISDTLRSMERVSRHMEVAALDSDPSVSLKAIRATALAEAAATSYADLNLSVLVAESAMRRDPRRGM